MHFKKSNILFVIGLFLAVGTCAKAQIQVAGDLFVDLRATDFDASTGIWTTAADCGECVGDFIVEGSPTRVESDEGVVSVSLNGLTDFFTLEGETPVGLTGANPTRSIEVWAFNPTIASEETLVAWGRRGGPDGSNMSFNYGNNPMYGAVGHWGGASMDKGWNADDATPGAPAAGQWHHLAYTYDGESTRVYSDGELVGEESLGFGAIHTHALDDQGNPLPIRIGSQNDADGNPTAGLRGSLNIGQVRIHDGVLDSVEILTNYLLEEQNYPNPIPPEPPAPRPLSAAPIHRYSFSEGPTDDAFGRSIIDSISGADGGVVGEGSSATASTLSLNGGSSDVAAYVDLPNGILSALGDEVTVEGWFRLDGSQPWSRVFDFGSSQAGEQFLPGGTGEGLDYLILSAQVAGNTNSQRFEVNNRDEVGGASANALTDVAGVGVDQMYHFAAVVDGGDGESPVATLYIDGAKVGGFVANAEAQISGLNDVNNWLGRSNWTADANVQGTYDEFRLYNYALDEDEVLGNFEAGPDTINVQQEGIPGDVDGDGKVNAADLNIVGLHWQENVETGTNGDLDGNGRVDASDLNLIGLNWQAGAGEATTAAVPEPSGFALAMAITGLLLLGTRNTNAGASRH